MKREDLQAHEAAQQPEPLWQKQKLDEARRSSAPGWPVEEQLIGVWSVLRNKTGGQHGPDCKGRVYECVEEVLDDLERKTKQLAVASAVERETKAEARVRQLERENQLMRTFIHALTRPIND